MSDGATPMHAAIENGHEEVVRALLDADASVDLATTKGCTPLFVAARGGKDEAFAALIEAGADAQLTNKRGHSLVEIVGGTRHQTDGRKAILKMLKKL